jgi:hypothetical protein
MRGGPSAVRRFERPKRISAIGDVRFTELRCPGTAGAHILPPHGAQILPAFLHSVRPSPAQSEWMETPHVR